MSEDKYVLSIRFDTDEPEFARGFEAGRIWQRLQADSGPQGHMVWAANIEMFMRMGEALGRTVRGSEPEGVIGEGWWTVEFGPMDTTPFANDWDALA